MYLHSDLPKPLRTTEFYILLALARGVFHAYALKSQVYKDSLGSVAIPDAQLYPLITRLHDQGLIDMEGTYPAGKSGKPRLHYATSAYGRIRLQEEAARLSHAHKILTHAGLASSDTPTDIQRLTLDQS